MAIPPWGGVPPKKYYFLAEKATQSVAAATTITVTDGTPVTPFTTASGSNITSTATPFIAAGRDGQLIVLRNDNGTDNAGLILSDTNYLANSGMRLDADTLTLAGTSVAGFVYSATLSSWVFQWYKKLKHYTGAINTFVATGSAGAWESGDGTSALTHEWGDGSTTNDTAPVFAITYTGIPTAAAITLDAGAYLTLTSPFTAGTGGVYYRSSTGGGTRTFALTATVNGSSVGPSNVVVTYRGPNYCGASSTSTGISDGTLTGFSDRQLDTDAYGTHTITTSAGQYLWFACPSTYATPYFYKTSDSERVGFTLDATNTHVGSYLKSTNYKKFVSVNTNLGAGGAFGITMASSDGLIRNWFGASASVTNEATIEALSGSLLDSDAISSMGSIGSAGGQYLWFCYPTSYSDPSYFANTTNNIRALFTVQSTAVALTNQYGYPVSGGYDIFRSAITNMPTKTYASTNSRPPNSRFVGPSSSVTTSADILALSADTADVTESPNGTWQGHTVSSGKKIWWCASNTNNGGAPANFGMALGSPGTSASSYQKAAFTAQTPISFTNNYGYTENYYAYSSDISELQAVNINATTSGTVSLKTQAAAFNNRIYMGPHTDSASITSAHALTLDDTSSGISELASSWAGSYALTVTGSNYLWMVHPASFGTKAASKITYLGIAVDGDYIGGIATPTTLSLTNDYGYVEDYYMWRSTNVGILPIGGTIVVAA